MENRQAVICKNIFKHGKTTKEQFTKKWIEMVKAMEKIKGQMVS